MRLMSIDFGEKRVGVASTDEGGEFALPRVVITESPSIVDEIERLANDWHTERIVIGESRDFKGNPNAIHAEAEKLADELKKRGHDIVFHTEVLTSMEAERLQGHNDMHDASAAALILKSYIDSNTQ